MRDMGPILAKIERLEKDCAYWNNEHSKETVRADKLQKEVESLKAITELAVKGLKQYAAKPFADGGGIARTTLSEIERLQNG